MSQSPGHRKWPDHQVREESVTQRMTVEVMGERVADSRGVVRVVEDRHPDRYYFPRADVKADALVASATTTECPFKGTARYFGLRTGERVYTDAAWSYEDPYDEHRGLKDRVAFHDDTVPQIHIQTKE